ncbi:hypothetical protein SESBI_01183 [Sesbania bispinosa]|nr:hypothetical protein SESBI_01183 [Sesbania bispinosa]
MASSPVHAGTTCPAIYGALPQRGSSRRHQFRSVEGKACDGERTSKRQKDHDRE